MQISEFLFKNFSEIRSEEELQAINGGIADWVLIGGFVAIGQLGIAVYNAGYNAGKDRALAGKRR